MNYVIQGITILLAAVILIGAAVNIWAGTSPATEEIIKVGSLGAALFASFSFIVTVTWVAKSCLTEETRYYVKFLGKFVSTTDQPVAFALGTVWPLLFPMILWIPAVHRNPTCVAIFSGTFIVVSFSAFVASRFDGGPVDE